MVVVLRYEKEMVDKAHGLLQARMQEGVRDYRMVERFELVRQCSSSSSKAGKDVLYLTLIVIGFVRPAILQVGCGKMRFALDKIVDSRTP